MCMCVHIYIYTHMHRGSVYVCVYIHTYIYMHIMCVCVRTPSLKQDIPQLVPVVKVIQPLSCGAYAASLFFKFF